MGCNMLLPLKSERDIFTSGILVDGYLKQILHKDFRIWWILFFKIIFYFIVYIYLKYLFIIYIYFLIKKD